MNLAFAEVQGLATLARCLCGNSADADDLVQDTLERALRAQYVEVGARRGWLATILRNRHRDEYRAKVRHPRQNIALENFAMPEPPEPGAWESFTEEHIASIMDQLDPGFRRVFELHTAGRSYKQIAHELGISINTVGTRLMRARHKLKEILLASSSTDDERRDVARRGVACEG